MSILKSRHCKNDKDTIFLKVYKIKIELGEVKKLEFFIIINLILKEKLPLLSEIPIIY